MGVKSTVLIIRTEALRAIETSSVEWLLKVSDRNEFLRKAGEFYDWNVRTKLDPNIPLREIEDKLEEVRDIHNPEGGYYFENYSVIEDEWA